MPAISAHGKICYLELPSKDVERSADFYRRVFNWNIRRRGDGELGFDDPVEVSGRWVLGREPAQTLGFLVHIMVDSVAATLDLAVAHGAEIVQGIGADAPEITARLRDPDGNIIGLYQEPS